jgi:hypothetical protein
MFLIFLRVSMNFESFKKFLEYLNEYDFGKI